MSKEKYMPSYNFDLQKKEWARPPIGGRTTSSEEMLKLPDNELRQWVLDIWDLQYSQPSNFGGWYRKYLKLDDTKNKIIIDFGCGFGFDSLSYAKQGNEVILADIVPSNIEIAKRVLNIFGYEPYQIVEVTNKSPFFYSEPYDIFHASGVIHHIPYAREILLRAADRLLPNGEIRLMLYTKELFKEATGEDPVKHVKSDVSKHPKFQDYVRWCDAVGYYADWYNMEKLNYLISDFLRIESFGYLCPNRANCVAILKVK